MFRVERGYKVLNFMGCWWGECHLRQSNCRNKSSDELSKIEACSCLMLSLLGCRYALCYCPASFVLRCLISISGQYPHRANSACVLYYRNLEKT